MERMRRRLQPNINTRSLTEDQRKSAEVGHPEDVMTHVEAGIATLREAGVPIISQLSSEVFDNATEAAWFEGGEEDSAVEFSRPVRVERFNRRLDRHPRTAVSMLLAGMVISNATCIPKHPQGREALSGMASEIHFVHTPTGIDIRVPETHSDLTYAMHIVDYNTPAAWDAELLPMQEIGQKNFVADNRMYQFHVGVVMDQYLRTEGVVSRPGDLGQWKLETPNASTVIDSGHPGEQGGELRVNKYANEPARMPAGIYPTVGEMHGMGSAFADLQANFSFGDREKFSTYFFERAQQILDEHGWDSFDELSAQQWVLLLDESVSGVHYDTSLASFFSDYDPAMANAVNQMPLDELWERRDEGWVCRDTERMKFGFYVIADEEFHLSERGLLLVPLVRYSDALHARDAYVIATSATDSTLVVTDTTNTSYVRSAEQQDSSEGAAAVWYGQQFGKEWLPPDVAKDFYQTALHYFGDELYLSTEAIAKREILVATLEMALASARQGDAVDARRQYTEGFEMLSRQLGTEVELGEAGASLQRGERAVPLFDLLLTVAKQADAGDSTQRNYLLALQQFEGYRSHKGMTPEDIEVARLVIQDIDVKDPHERAQREAIVRNEILRLEKELGIQR